MLDKKEIIGMKITSKIIFDNKYNTQERNQLMNDIECEIEKVIIQHNNLIAVGGKGEWIYEDGGDI